MRHLVQCISELLAVSYESSGEALHVTLAYYIRTRIRFSFRLCLYWSADLMKGMLKWRAQSACAKSISMNSHTKYLLTRRRVFLLVIWSDTRARNVAQNSTTTSSMQKRINVKNIFSNIRHTLFAIRAKTSCLQQTKANVYLANSMMDARIRRSRY